MIELVAPAGDMEKLKAALHFGADAVYLSAKNYGLRAFTQNFTNDDLKTAVDLCHAQGKKTYVTINIFAHNHDFDGLKDYAQYLQAIGVDAVIVSDIGVLSFIKECAPKLNIHISTQANTTNKYSAQFYTRYAKRVVLARELNLNEIKEIHDFNPTLQLEAFVHGAMCISYSGRCLMSDAFTGRRANGGECVQACRWNYTLASGQVDEIEMEQDSRGTYIMNSRDINMIEYVDKLFEAGITSFKIEGRAKSVYYAAGAVNAYRRAIDIFVKNGRYSCPQSLKDDLDKISNRTYHTGFYFGRAQQYLESSRPVQPYEFCALVVERKSDGVVVEMRNRFKTGDELEILSPNESNGQTLVIKDMYALDKSRVDDALNVQQRLFIPTDINLNAYDILRKRC